MHASMGLPVPGGPRISKALSERTRHARLDLAPRAPSESFERLAGRRTKRFPACGDPRSTLDPFAIPLARRDARLERVSLGSMTPCRNAPIPVSRRNDHGNRCGVRLLKVQGHMYTRSSMVTRIHRGQAWRGHHSRRQVIFLPATRSLRIGTIVAP
jgi:hypothetical protein